MRGLWIVSLVACLALTSCIGTHRDATAGDAKTSAPGGGSSPVPTSGVPGAAASTALAALARSHPSSKATPSPLPSGPAHGNTMPLDVKLNRTCARVGDDMSAAATTLPGAQIAFAAAYSDNTLVPDFTYVPKDENATGSYTWRWVIRPDIPEGDAILTVVVSKNGKGASFNQPFRIAHTC